MTSPILSLRAAIRGLCLGDAALAGLMDAAIHDEAPRGSVPVYATFGDVELRDDSTSTESGHAQDFAILVWAKRGNAAGAIAAADRMSRLLDGASPALAGHRLVSLAVTRTEADLDEESVTTRVALRLRAVTEVLA